MKSFSPLHSRSKYQLQFFSLLSVCLITLLPAHGQQAALRTFSNIQGVKFQGRLVAVSADKATLQLANGRNYTTSIASFSPADQAYIKAWNSNSSSGSMTSLPAPVKSGVKIDKINALLGLPLFIDGDLWNNPSGQTAKRLRWPRESNTPFSSSYRGYPEKNYRIAQTRPYSVVLYGDNGKVSSLSVVFANKGDFFSAAGSGENHFIKGKAVPDSAAGLRKLMDYDTKIISEALTKALGSPKRQQFGDGSTRQIVYRWDWSGHAFLLSKADGEYVNLSIQPVAFADKRGRMKRIPDSVISKRLQDNIERRDNGDVVINNIPMVNQGPKGYCVPATAERCMRYLGIPADMYLLAMAGKTEAGGGTSATVLLEAVGRDIKRKGRSFNIWDSKLKLREIAQYIDQGIPVMWGLFSTKEFNKTADSRTMERKNSAGWSQYKAKIKRVSNANKLTVDPDTSHVVIITGYNKSTGEIAFSDSWGERYKERWITISEAQQVSQDRFYVVEL